MLGTLLKIGKMGIREYLQYKSMLFIFTLNRIIEVVVYIFVWYAIYNQTGQIEGFAINEIATYYILVVTLVPMSLWGVNEDIAYSIRKGYITRELLNPISYFTYYFGKELGEMGFGLLTAICTFIVCNIFWTNASKYMGIYSFYMYFIIKYTNIIFLTNDSRNMWLLYKCYLGNANIKKVNNINIFRANSTTYNVPNSFPKNSQYITI